MENKALKILFIPNWKVTRLSHDDASLQAPDKVVEGCKYWFFRHFNTSAEVDVIDIGGENLWRKLEHKIKFYISQPVKAFTHRNSCDVVVSHGAQSGLFYELLASFVKKKPLHVMIDVGGLNGARINNCETPLIRFALRKSPVIIVHSSPQLDFYKRYYPKLRENVHFVPFGTDFGYFSQAGEEAEAQERLFVSVGSAKRDYITLCEAWKRAGVENYKLRIIGDESLARRYSGCPGIEFSGRKPLAEVIELTRRCTAVIVPLPEFCYSYGQMTVLQSMAMGKPLIVTSTTSTVDYIAQAPGVMATEVGNVEAMAQCVKKMCALTSDELKKMGSDNQAFVKAHFSEEQMAQKIEAIISQYLMR
ncbi:MAG: glycosyltransferase family 4 protein [Muribaculaceae bacterium]|nr:glycosyltransferase family 4 protein [Muribaculaceae bacterium]MBQ5409218.1 glycosyltransferase family 4 protein [Muribaculaceae bacterium]MDY6413444.1 glycosyltransferase family 4 protein [Bacteroidales bacterium]